MFFLLAFDEFGLFGFLNFVVVWVISITLYILFYSQYDTVHFNMGKYFLVD